MDVLVITQARTGSTRLPEKVLREIKHKSLLQIHIERIIKAKNISKLIIATTTDKSDDAIVKIADKLGIDYYRGSVDDVLDRFYQAAKKYKPKWIVRLTSDCPLIDPELIDKIVECAKNRDLDYCSNILVETYPDGEDIEVFKFSALEKAWKEAKLKSEREHVTPFIRKNSGFVRGKIFTSDNYPCEENYNKVRLTVDELGDFKVIEYLIGKLGFDASWKDYTDEYLKSKISELNMSIERNEGYQKSLKEDK